MSCNQCIEGDNGGTTQAYRSVMRKARKTHECAECGDAIQPGELYEYASGVGDCGPFSYKTCAGCSSVRGAFYCGGFTHESLWVDMEECVFPSLQMAGECWEKLTAVGKAHLLRRWREWKGFEEGK